MPKVTKGYYAVNRGRIPGVYLTWDECEAQVKGFHAAKYKKFTDQAEAEAFAGCGASAASAEIASTSTSKPVPSPSTSPKQTSPYKRPVSNQPVPHTSPSKFKPHSASLFPPKPVKAMPLKPSKRIPVKSVTWAQRDASPDISDESSWDVVYSDGACKRNGQPDAAAGVGVWYGQDDPRNVSERCPGDQTNNRAELIAIVRILEEAPTTGKLLVKTDSRYSMDCFKKWLPRWRTNGFMSGKNQPVKNQPLIRYLSSHLDIRASQGQTIRLQYIKAHVGHTGNEGADQLAGAGALLPVTPERPWDELERGIRAKLKAMETVEGGGIEISDVDLEFYAGGLAEDEDLEKDLDFYADGLADDDELWRELAEA